MLQLAGHEFRDYFFTFGLNESVNTSAVLVLSALSGPLLRLLLFLYLFKHFIKTVQLCQLLFFFKSNETKRDYEREVLLGKQALPFCTKRINEKE